MKQLFYRIIYHPGINKVLRNLNKVLSPILPGYLQVPPSGTLTIELNDSSFKFCTNQTNYTSQILFWKGIYAMEYTVIFEQLIKKCDCFYDIGSHAGYYSLIAVSQNPTIKVVAFEPASGPFHYLQKNISINNFNSIHAYQMAIGEKDGHAEFLEATHHKYKYLKHNLLAISNLKEEKQGRTMKRVDVRVLTLDKFVSDFNEPYPDILKLDTEGTEHTILQHAQNVLANKPIVICETLFNTIEDKLEKIMGNLGYLFFNHKNGKLQQVKSIIRMHDDGVRDCFFVHPEKKHLIQEFTAS